MRRITLAFALGVLASPAAAQQPACVDDAFRQFDYWVGQWTVTDTAGTVIGSNTISAVSGGCALLEQWTSAQGNTGVSINFHDPASGGWTQHWVGAGGSILHLTGGLVDGAMQLGGERTDGNGARVLDRIRWIPLGPGKVRQHWEISQDGGATWATAFNGTYTRTSGSSGDGGGS